MNGLVVHAVAGRRDEYRPLHGSVIASSPKPEDVLNGFRMLGCSYIYIADIDAILGRGCNQHVIDVALSYGFKVLADIGRKGLEETDSDNLSYVIGTEYIIYPNELHLLSNRVVSLDIESGEVVFRNTKLGIAQATKKVCKQNVKTVIILNLDRVGTMRGLDIDAINIVKDLCRTRIAVGGGFRDVEELKILNDLGVHFVLIATAIHKGIVNRCWY